MAASKERQRRSTQVPDPAPFLQVYEQGLADLDDVVVAYGAMLAHSGHVFALQPGDVVQDRREALTTAQNIVTGRLVELHRLVMWKSNETQGEA